MIYPPYIANTYTIAPVGTAGVPSFVEIMIKGRYLYIRDITGIAADVLHVQFEHFVPQPFPRKGWLQMPPAEEYGKVTLINTSLSTYAVVKVILSMGQYGEAIVSIDNEIPPPLAPNHLSGYKVVTYDAENDLIVQVPANPLRRELMLQNNSGYDVHIAGDWNLPGFYNTTTTPVPEIFGAPLDRTQYVKLANGATLILSTSAAVYILGDDTHSGNVVYLETTYDLSDREPPPQ